MFFNIDLLAFVFWSKPRAEVLEVRILYLESIGVLNPTLREPQGSSYIPKKFII